jgi:hypothetical protein
VDDTHDSDLSSILAEETVVEITPSPPPSSTAGVLEECDGGEGGGEGGGVGEGKTRA